MESWEVPEGEGTFDFTELWQRKGEGVQSWWGELMWEPGFGDGLLKRKLGGDWVGTARVEALVSEVVRS